MITPDNQLIPCGKMVKLFPDISPRTFLSWLAEDLIPYSKTKQDGRGTIYFFSAADIVQIRQFIDNRFKIREAYRIRKNPLLPPKGSKPPLRPPKIKQ
jgi:hypothetical protein